MIVCMYVCCIYTRLIASGEQEIEVYKMVNDSGQQGKNTSWQVSTALVQGGKQCTQTPVVIHSLVCGGK